jgi:hypothetical protein
MMTTRQPKPAARKPKRDDPEQSKLFIIKARELGADADHSGADELLGRLAKLPPQPKRKK